MRKIEKTLFQFIWKHSKREQFVLLAVTTALFPFLFLTLELPKRIINDAIGAQTNRIEIMGFALDQVQFLGLLCVAAVSAEAKDNIRLDNGLVRRVLEFDQGAWRTV